MAKALLKDGSLNCDDLTNEDDPLCVMEQISLNIVNAQNYQIMLMRNYLEAKGAPEFNDCEVKVATTQVSSKLADEAFDNESNAEYTPEYGEDQGKEKDAREDPPMIVSQVEGREHGEEHGKEKDASEDPPMIVSQVEGREHVSSNSNVYLSSSLLSRTVLAAAAALLLTES